MRKLVQRLFSKAGEDQATQPAEIPPTQESGVEAPLPPLTPKLPNAPIPIHRFDPEVVLWQALPPG